jgi:hypothetical protein
VLRRGAEEGTPGGSPLVGHPASLCFCPKEWGTALAVRVHLDQASTVVNDYDNGNSASLNNGHLMVFGRDANDVIAIYAPGSWHHVDIA